MVLKVCTTFEMSWIYEYFPNEDKLYTIQHFIFNDKAR